MAACRQKKKIICIVGPTASGKTAVGVALARRIKGEIVSCDSMQVYTGVNIVVNKPSGQELAAVDHHLIGVIPLTQSFDVVQFERMARRCIDDIFSREHVPVITGGTGLYMKVLLDGIFASGRNNPEIRRVLLDELKREGSPALHKELARVDDEASQKIHPNDSRRVIRALEVYRATGKPISRLQKETQGLWNCCDVSIFGLKMERESLYNRINARVDQMFDAGLPDEIRALKNTVLSSTAKAVIGIAEAGKYLSGEWTLDQAKEEMKKNTRRLAKRQMTWFRAEKRLRWIDIDPGMDPDDAAGRILKELSKT